MSGILAWLRASWLPLLIGLILGRFLLPRFV